ncbi:MAG TPA: hypothetical protein PKW80_14785 [Bacteroidales bacterium]|nr:hypothetical protein [Bacteroidales bacterium]
MAKATIPADIQNKVQNIIADFNKKVFSKTPEFSYYAIFRGSNLLLNRKEGEKDSPIARLKFNGSMENWDFAIFKWSSERYDPDEFLFPGSQYVDGTIKGALNAGHEAYPPSYTPSDTDLLNFMKYLDSLSIKRKK